MYEGYKTLKNDLIKLPESTLIVEFDYAQNVALPRLNVCAQFYRRLIWLYIFNIPNVKDGTSRMYSFLEGQARKNPDSVVSFLFHYLQDEVTKANPRITKIILLSDAAGSQNKNISIVQFCLWFSRLHNIEIQHVYPVRGHSFNSCDRNFALFKKKQQESSSYCSCETDTRTARGSSKTTV